MLSATIIVPISPIPSHPSTEMLERAVRSIHEHLGAHDWPLILVCDGGTRDRSYSQFKEHLRALVAHDKAFQQASVLECTYWRHLSGVLEEALQHVKTELVLIFQHDHEVRRRVNIAGILACFANPAIKHLRLNRHDNKVEGWDFILEPFPEAPIPLLKTAAWSDMPHFVRKTYYTDFILPQLRWSNGELQRVFPESIVFPRFVNDVKKHGFSTAHPIYGTFLYGALGDPAICEHLDGKGYGVPGYIKTNKRQSIKL